MKHARVTPGPSFATKLVAFALVSLVWIVFDRVTKLWADAHEPGDVLVEDIAGLFEFKLVHNTGAAWGMFSDATQILGIFSIVVCVIILILFFTYIRTSGTMAQSIFLAFVFAGGIGNAIDRIQYSYVVDFINAKFIEFPVFNVADIGVTCGIVLFLIAFLIHDARSSRSRVAEEA